MIFDFRLKKEKLVEVLRLHRGRKRGRLVRHYFLASALLISAGLITSGLLEIYFGYQESWDLFGKIQKEIATGTAFKIEQFVQEIERDMKAATRSRELVRDGLSPDYKWELRRLLVNVPSITGAVAFDTHGATIADARRARPPITKDDWNSAPPALLDHAKQGKSYFGPVYFKEGTGPYMVLAVPIERIAGDIIGVLRAEIDLKYVGQVMSAIRVGKAGYAYLVTKGAQLIAHSDLSFVLQNRNLTQLDQVQAAFRSSSDVAPPKAVVTRNTQGAKVFSSYALIANLDWAVFAEQPIEEIYAPLYASVVRTSGAFLVALGVALLATLLVRRRVVRPLEALRHGVARVREGDLAARLDVRTGDEIEALANEFNEMAAHLTQAYSDLENKVVERTSALTITNEKLAEVSEHKSRFLANVNHELRTPLSSIIGYARLLRRETEGQISSLQRENLEDLLRNAERLLGLIDSLLDFAKIESGKLEIQLEPVQIDELVQGAMATIEPILNKDSVRLVRDVPATIAPLYTDREKLRQIILNLLGNAVKFTDRGEIKISASQENGDFKLAVADTGIGIDEADIDRIFEEFDRGRLSSDRAYRGTGLGLAIVKKLVDVLGGSIAVESEVGKGSAFTVRLPLKRNEATTV
ncbi:MAG TPA: sensor histidine kinase [Pyrinomonadaceae bacterium]|nr:sensor histidine kinase [Pyrinomonadaceae bacterium]HXK28964.1 sensor histidine kinase [Candidatus Binatia bacterium]